MAALLLAAGAATAYAHDTTGISTLDQTIIGDDQDRIGDRSTREFSFLELGPGERYTVREDLARARPGRADRRRSLLYAGQITDFQLSDEESPARVEFLDRNPLSEDFKSAHRPQEALVAHQVDFTIRQLNRFVRSPVRQGSGRRARMVNAVMTGDLADNQHLNETEWVHRLLEGGEVDPNSGSTEDADYAGEGCPPAGEARDDLIAEAPLYTGVQDYDDYPPLVGRDRNFYDPDDPQGRYQRRHFPTYEGLLDKAQEPFEARGLRVPSYVAFGNHDGLAQGNEDAIQPYELVGTGCLKPFPPRDPASLPGPGGDSVLEELLTPETLQNTSLVPPDEDRQYVDKRQFKAVFAGGEQADDHGFAFVDQDEFDASRGAASYYSFVPDTGSRAIRYVVLDTLSEGGVVGVSSRGNIDDPQWQWLRDELRRAERRDELVMVWAHHGINSLDADVPDEAAPPCEGPPDEHGHDTNPGCDRDPRMSRPLHFGEDLERLFHRFPSVIALIAGHSHNNRIQGYADRDRSGDFWEIKSPAIVDWPPQHRLIEVMNNRDGTLSIFGTILDHDGPSAAPEAGDASTFSLAELASVGRTISYNDDQEGPDGSPGRPNDRNVELLLRDPRASDRRPPQEPQPPEGPGPPPPDGDGRNGPGNDGGRGGGRGAGDGAADRGPVALGAGAGAGGGGGLPFTGLGLALLALVGAALLSSGVALRRRSRS